MAHHLTLRLLAPAARRGNPMVKSSRTTRKLHDRSDEAFHGKASPMS